MRPSMLMTMPWHSWLLAADDGGGAGGEGEGEGEGGEGGKPDPTKGDLGDAGKKAIDEERKARKTAERDAATAKKELEELKRQGMSDVDKKIAEARDEATKEADAKANERIVRTEVRAAAAGKLADPGDAHAFLGDLTRFVDKDGEVDTDAIAKAVDKLVKEKPYLAAGGRPGALPGGGGKTSESQSMNDLLRSAAGITPS